MVGPVAADDDVTRRELERAAYGPGGTLRDLQALRDHVAGRTPHVSGDVAESSLPRLRRVGGGAAVALVIAVGVLVVVTGVVMNTAQPNTPAHDLTDHAWHTAVSRVLDSRGKLAPTSAYDLDRSRLPRGWRTITGSLSATELGGAQPIPVHVPLRDHRLLLVVACDPSDRSFQWTIGSATGYGTCGQLTPTAIGLTSRHPAALEVMVETRGLTPFSLSIWTSGTAN